MVRYLIDTNVYIHALQGNLRAQKILIEADQVVVPFIMLGELEYGFRNGAHFKENKAKLAYFLAGDNILIKHSSHQTIEIYGLLKSELKRKGKPIPENDVWIAALTIEAKAQLVSFDRHFTHLDGLDVRILS